MLETSLKEEPSRIRTIMSLKNTVSEQSSYIEHLEGEKEAILLQLNLMTEEYKKERHLRRHYELALKQYSQSSSNEEEKQLLLLKTQPRRIRQIQKLTKENVIKSLKLIF